MRPCVRATTFWERFLWWNRPQRFFMAKPVLFFYFFFHPFSAGCPGLIPGVFFFRPFSAGCLGLIPGVFFFPRPYPAGCPCLFSLRIFQRIFVTIFFKKFFKGCFAPLCVPLGLKKPGDFTVSEGHGHPLVGEGGGFPRVRAVVGQVSPCCSWLVPTPKVVSNLN